LKEKRRRDRSGSDSAAGWWCNPSTSQREMFEEDPLS
jgi:hypothetical protein